MPGKKWTKKEVAALRKLAKVGIGSATIAEKMQEKFDRKFTVPSVKSAASTRKIVIEPMLEPKEKLPDGKAATNKNLRLNLQREQKARKALTARMQAMIQTHDVPLIEYHGKSYLHGLISDTHYGSLWERPDLVRKAYAIMKKEGVRDVYHTGDILEGSGMRKGQEYELAVVGADNQVRHAVDLHPEYKGMHTYFILGSHDLSFHKSAGHNIGPDIDKARDDMTYLGGEVATVPVTVDGTPINLMLVHPGKGTSYALSYQPQKLIESLPGGRKPEVCYIGHYHKSLHMPAYRNVVCLLAGCLQSQTDWMARQHLAAEMGFWMCEVRTTKNGIARFKAEFTPFFEL